MIELVRFRSTAFGLAVSREQKGSMKYKFKKGQKLIADLTAYDDSFKNMEVKVVSCQIFDKKPQYTVQILDQSVLEKTDCPDCQGEYADTGLRDVSEGELKLP